MTAGYETPRMPAPPQRRGVDVLGLIAVILAMVALLPTIVIFAIGLIPEMNAIWWLLIVVIPLLGIGAAVVLVLAVIGLIVGLRAHRRYALSIVGIVLGLVMLAPIALLYVSSSV
ncbi:hypothetical protein ACIQLJ_03360 [Microbacterium sp. NPDC091313]